MLECTGTKIEYKITKKSTGVVYQETVVLKNPDTNLALIELLEQFSGPDYRVDSIYTTKMFGEAQLLLG